MCGACGAVFTVDDDRQRLGLARVRLLPGSAPADAVARSETPPTVQTGAPPDARPAGGPPPPRAESVGGPAPPRRPEAPLPLSILAMRRTILQLRLAVAGVALVAAVLAVLLAGSQPAVPGQRGPEGALGGGANAGPGVEELGKTPAGPPAWAEFNLEAARLATSEDAADLGRALTLLRRIRDDAPLVDQPADIGARIAEISARLEDLRLRKYAK